jgi:predicted enzyme related to lactoylglutathione lyase
VPEQRLAYLAVDNVDARVNKATAAGATLKRPLFDVPGVDVIKETSVAPKRERRRPR